MSSYANIFHHRGRECLNSRSSECKHNIAWCPDDNKIVRLIMYEYLGSCLEAAKKKISWLMEIESDPFTLNNHYMSDCKEKFLTYYRRSRQDAIRNSHLHRTNMSRQENERVTADALSHLVRLGYEVSRQDLDRLLRPDTMEPALVVMASVRAYFRGMFIFESENYSSG